MLGAEGTSPEGAPPLAPRESSSVLARDLRSTAPHLVGAPGCRDSCAGFAPAPVQLGRQLLQGSLGDGGSSPVPSEDNAVLCKPSIPCHFSKV